VPRDSAPPAETKRHTHLAFVPILLKIAILMKEYKPHQSLFSEGAHTKFASKAVGL
jgi:hypothetical protein